MIKKLLSVSFLVGWSMFAMACGKNNGEPQVPIVPDTTKQKVQLADPFILKHDGVYYMYGTADLNPDDGIPVYRSNDLVKWEGPLGKASNGLALSKGQSFGDSGFWAPYVM